VHDQTTAGQSKSTSRKRTVAIVQSNYLPWRGYFDMIRSVDEFILFDSVQYTRRDWRNRNIIKTPQGPRWITIPVEVKGKYFQAINETRIADPRWAAKHIRTIEANYRRAAAFEEVASWLFPLLEGAGNESLLSKANERLLLALSERLNIETSLRRCTDLIPRGDLAAMGPSERLLALCQAAGAGRYLSGPSARTYLDEGMFSTAGIEVAWMDYGGYPDYPQLWGPFDGEVSIVDLLLNVGEAAPRFTMRSVTEAAFFAREARP